MAKGNFVFNDGEGNLSRMMYGYSQKTKRILDEMAKAFIEYIDWEFEHQKPIDGVFMVPPVAKWQELHEFTRLQKKSGWILYTSGSLKNSYRAERLSDTLLWIGSDSPLAIIHEYGLVINVTDKMRKYLAAKGLYLKKSTKVLHISIDEQGNSTRPIFRPVYWKLWSKFKDVIMKEQKNLDFTPVHVRPK